MDKKLVALFKRVESLAIIVEKHEEKLKDKDLQIAELERKIK